MIYGSRPNKNYLPYWLGHSSGDLLLHIAFNSKRRLDTSLSTSCEELLSDENI